MTLPARAASPAAPTAAPQPVESGMGAGAVFALAGGVAFAALTAVLVVIQQLTGWWLVDAVLGVAAAGALLSLGDGIVTLLRVPVIWLFRRAGRDGPAHRMASWRTWPLGWGFMTAAAAAAPLALPRLPIGVGALGTIVIPIAALSAAAVVAARRLPRRSHQLAAVVFVAVANAGLLAFLLTPGPGRGVAVAPPHPSVFSLTLPPPGQLGGFAVESLTYGSEIDPRRPEYRRPDLRTDPIDASVVFGGVNALHDRWIAFATGARPDRLPRNAAVWSPAGPGPFPLVLLVHGNHPAGRPSDAGYGYLGEHLASHGYLVASIDQRFLNGSLFGDGGGRDVAARTWLIAAHLEQWADWATAPSGRFAGRVDLERVGIVGHSRGGEAAAHAARMAGRAPDEGFPDVRGRLRVRAVAAFAPGDGQWRRGPLEDMSYLLVGGALDADTSTLQGFGQYQRTTIPHGSDAFKALAYLQRANHGQFNTVWGRSDLGPLDSLLLDRGALLSPTEQQHAAKVLLTAFLDAALRDVDGYRQVFTRPDTVAAGLPEDVLVTAYADATTSLAAADAEAAQNTGESLEPVGGATLDIEPLLARDGERNFDGHAHRVRWPAGAHPGVQLQLAEPFEAGERAMYLAIDLAFAGTTPRKASVLLHDARNGTATAPLDVSTALRPPLTPTIAKLPRLLVTTGALVDLAWPEERVLQTYMVPIAAFTDGDGVLELSTLRGITIQFDGRADGDVLLDNLRIGG